MERVDPIKLKSKLDEVEKKLLSQYATYSSDAIRLRNEDKLKREHRQNFSIDADRILHSLAYTRYIDKTQVFYLIPNDHITHRVLHVQLVSKIARTIGRHLRLNLDLIEAIALGHDIGHPPFGHDGEKILAEITFEHGLGFFQHNIQSIRFLELIERKGRGWNLSLQVLDGILCHDGEVEIYRLEPRKDKNFKKFHEEIEKKRFDPDYPLMPMTMEGCVVRLADTISYIGRDLEDAIRLGVIERDDIPYEATKVLGNTNGAIVYTLVDDVIRTSYGHPYVSFSKEVGYALKVLKEFNTKRIYCNPTIKSQTEKIRKMYRFLFDSLLTDLNDEDKDSRIFRDFLADMSSKYIDNTEPAQIVADFIAGMTDRYFINLGKDLFIPSTITGNLKIR